MNHNTLTKQDKDAKIFTKRKKERKKSMQLLRTSSYNKFSDCDK